MYDFYTSINNMCMTFTCCSSPAECFIMAQDLLQRRLSFWVRSANQVLFVVVRQRPTSYATPLDSLEHVQRMCINDMYICFVYGV